MLMELKVALLVPLLASALNQCPSVVVLIFLNGIPPI